MTWPIRNYHSTGNVLDTLTTLSVNRFPHFFNVGVCFLCWWTTKVFIMLNWYSFCFESRKPFITLCLTYCLVAKCLMKHFVSFTSHFTKLEIKFHTHTHAVLFVKDSILLQKKFATTHWQHNRICPSNLNRMTDWTETCLYILVTSFNQNYCTYSNMPLQKTGGSKFLVADMTCWKHRILARAFMQSLMAPHWILWGNTNIYFINEVWKYFYLPLNYEGEVKC